MRFLKESSWDSEQNSRDWGARYFDATTERKLELIRDAGLFDDMKEEVFNVTDRIIQRLFINTYSVDSNIFRDYETGFLSEEDRENAVKTMFRIINRYYKKVRDNKLTSL